MTPPKNSPSTDVSGAVLNPATARMAIPAPEITTRRTVPKTTTSSKIQHRRIEKPALTRERQIERSPSEDEASLEDDEFVMPEDPVEQERFKRRLMATASSQEKIAAA